MFLVSMAHVRACTDDDTALPCLHAKADMVAVAPLATYVVAMALIAVYVDGVFLPHMILLYFCFIPLFLFSSLWFSHHRRCPLYAW